MHSRLSGHLGGPLSVSNKTLLPSEKSRWRRQSRAGWLSLPWAALMHFSDREPLWKLPAWKHRTAPRKERLSCPKKPPPGRFGDRASAPPSGRCQQSCKNRTEGRGPGQGVPRGPSPSSLLPATPGAFHWGCGPPFKSWHPPSLPATLIRVLPALSTRLRATSTRGNQARSHQTNGRHRNAGRPRRGTYKRSGPQRPLQGVWLCPVQAASRAAG